MEVAMQTDVVCGMKVDPSNAPAKSQYNGQTYYFCSQECKKKFDADPQRYVKSQQEQFAR
jgi:YHS domain-containing protein